jgi:hypothetical protein
MERISHEEGICPYWSTSSLQDEGRSVFNDLHRFSSDAPEIKISSSGQQFNSNGPISINYDFDSHKAVWKGFNTVDVIHLNDSLWELLKNKLWGDHGRRVVANFLVDILIPGSSWGHDRLGDMFEPYPPDAV